MSAFLYYVPGDYPQMALDKVAELGLAYAFERQPEARLTMHGPDDGSGPVFGIFEKLGDDLTGGYFPEKQTWRKIPKSECWIGYYNDAKPGPDDLMREQALDGHWVELGDGNKWLAPVARSCDADATEYMAINNLPVQGDIDDEGNWVQTKVSDRYAAIWDLATKFWDVFRDALRRTAEIDPAPDTVPVQFGEFYSGAVTALAVNYRVSNIECAVLALLTMQESTKILTSLIDLPTVNEWLKKNRERQESAT